MNYRGQISKKYVRAGELNMPTWYTWELWDFTEPGDPPIPYRVRIDVETVDGAQEVRGFSLEREPGGPPVTAEALRHVPLGRLLKEVAWRAARRANPNRKIGWALTGPSHPAGPGQWVKLGEETVVRTLRKRGATSDAVMEKVAMTYREALAMGEPPKQAVADALFVSLSHAGRLVVQARRRGFLPPTTPGRKKA